MHLPCHIPAFYYRRTYKHDGTYRLFNTGWYCCNNGIVLIDYINILRERDGYELTEAVLAACPTRLRPILMTALTTILGQFPMIFSNGSNSEMLRGMGLVIAGGLATSTFLTLVVVPLLYMFFDRINNAFRKKFHIKSKANPFEVEKECC